MADALHPHGPKTLMTDEEAFDWAWKKLKQDLGGEKWSAGDEVQMWGFFKYGWDHRAQLELQRYRDGPTVPVAN